MGMRSAINFSQPTRSRASLLIIATATGAMATGATATFAAPRPNIIFIMSDDHAYQAISAYGSPDQKQRLNETPNIDRIANQGIRFDRCYVTNSICAPARATILTGKYSHINGVRDNYTDFDGSQWTFPKAMQEAGYQTAMIGKWHLKSAPTGFDYWDVLLGQGFYYQPKFRSPAGVREIDGYVTDITTDLALNWLKGSDTPAGPGRDPNRPFMLMLQHKAPHRPWDPAPEHLKTFEDRDFPEPKTLFDDYATRTSAAHDAEMRISQMRIEQDLKVWQADNQHRVWLYNHMTAAERAAYESTVDLRYEEFHNASFDPDDLNDRDRTRWMWRHYLEDYLGCVASVDESVGQVLDWLDQAGLADNTLVIYTSDQGFYLGEHGWFDKRFMYEESLRTPLVLRWPAGVAREAGSGEPRIEERIVSNLDFAPTLLELAGAEGDPAMQGASMAPILEGASDEPIRDIFYYQYYEGPEKDHAVARHDGVTDGTHKLIHFYENSPESGGEWELYDLDSDPQELQNRFGDPAYASIQAKLKAALEEKRQELGVELAAVER